MQNPVGRSGLLFLWKKQRFVSVLKLQCAGRPPGREEKAQTVRDRLCFFVP